MADRANGIRFLVLGPLDVVGNGDSVLGGPKQRAVLGMLISRVGQPVSNDQLVDGIWGEDPPSAVQTSLHSYVSNLRTAVGADIERSGGGYALNADPADVDAAEFQRLVDEGTKAISANPESASEALRSGLALWRGKPYADLVGVEGLQTEIRRLEELRLSAVEARIDADLALGRHQMLVGELAALAIEYPLRERFQAQLMVALYRDGRQSEALRAYQRTRDYLVEELGIDPSTELQELELRILNHDPDLLTIRDTVNEHVAFLFTDIAGSTELWETRAAAMRSALARHDEILTKAIDNAGGRLFKHTGDGVLAAFPTVVSATTAAVDAQRQLETADWGDLDLHSRMGVDVGEVDARGGDYFGPPMNRGSRIMSAAHGGQILLSEPAQQALAAEPGMQVRSLGEHRLKGLGAPIRIFQLVADDLPTDFPDLRLDPTTAGPARQFGDAIRGYEIRERLAAGRVSVVYRAFQPTVGREVAVKVIRPEYANHPSFVRRFESEARTVAGLEHPHIVSLYDYWRDADGAYLVMPLMAGGSLADKNLGALPLDRVVGILGQVGSALGYAHRQGVIHRDIKPSNILLDADGNAYLADFGIAVRGVEREAGIQSESAIHRAPEDREGAAVDERSDIYSLAMVVAGLLTGSTDASPNLSSLDPPLRSLLESALAEDPADRPDTVDSFVGRLAALNGGMTVEAEPILSRNPYKGLSPFDVDDARDFFGRDNEIRRLVELVGANRIVTVVGPSGSGKSSLVRAGMVPALARGALAGSDQWVMVTTVPGSHPFDELASALAEVATESMGDMAAELASDDAGLLRLGKRLMRNLEGELVIVVDQFEELYTVVTSDDARSTFIRNLIEATSDARSRVRVILTLRADFYDHPLGDDILGPIVSEANLALAVPKPAELRDAIEKPAHNAGVVFEEGLTDQLLGDVQEQPGSLPLMQYALASLVAQSLDGRVSIADYERVGGVSGALTSRADEIYRTLNSEEQAVAEEIFMRLVSVSEDADDVRRRVRQSELESLGLEPGYVAEVLRRFGEARLLTFDRDPVTRGPTVEVAHEALLRNWVRFRDWLDARREALILHRRFRAAGSEWEEAGRDAAYLLTGGRLSQFESWATDSNVVLTPDETEFLSESLTARDAAASRRRRLRRGVLSGFGVAALIAIVLAVAAFAQRNEAQNQTVIAEANEAEAEAQREQAEAASAAEETAKEEALQQTAIAQARELTLEAEKVLEFDPELSAHLALASLTTLRAAGVNSSQAVSALRAAIAGDRVTNRFPGGEIVAVHPEGALVATGDFVDGNLAGVAVLDIVSQESVEHYGRDDAAPWGGAAFSPDGNLLAVGFAGQTTSPMITVWDRTTGDSVDIGPEVSEANGPVFSSNGEFLAFRVAKAIVVWSISEEEVTLQVPGYGNPDFSPDGQLSFFELPTEDGESNLVVVDPASGAVSQTLHITGFAPTQGWWTQWSPDGTRIVATDQTTAVVFDVESSAQLARVDLERVADPVWISNDAFVLAGESTPKLIDAATGEILIELPGQGGTFDIDVVPGTASVAYGGWNGEAVILDASPLGGAEIGGWRSPLTTNFKGGYVGDGSRAWLEDGGSLVTASALDGGDERVVSGDGNVWGAAALWFPDADPEGNYVFHATEGGSWVIQPFDSDKVIYRAPARWSIRAVSDDGAQALIKEGPGFRGPVRLVSIGDATAIDLDAVAVGVSWFSPDGSLVVLGNMGDVGIAFYDTATGERLLDFGGTPYGGLAAAFSRDGSKFVVGGFTGPVFVFDVETLLSNAAIDDALDFEIAAHDSLILGVVVSPDGSQVATFGWDEPLKLWDLDTGQPLGVFGQGTPTRPPLGDFHPTLPQLLVASPPNMVRIHTLDIDELIAIAESRLSREMTDEECQQYFREPCPSS